MRAIGDSEEMEEERRLCYVAITRAKEKLTICYAKQRMLYGRTNASLQSRFLREIPETAVERKGGFTTAYSAQHQAFNKPKTTNYLNNSYARFAPSAAATVVDYNKGDMVHHTAFGRGMILSVMKMGGDALLEIAFDEIGTKKLMAKNASAHMKRL